MFTLLIIEEDPASYRKIIDQSALPDLAILSAHNTDEATSLIDQADIILGRPAFVVPLISQATRLRWVQSTYAGVEPLCADHLRTDYLLTGVKDVFGPLMSEYVFAYILARERHLFEARDYQDKQEWVQVPYHGLNSRTIGLAGLGSIGRHVARTAAHFGMEVLGYKRTPGRVDGVDRVYVGSEKAQFLATLDYLILTLPETTYTKNFLSLDDFKMMKPSSTLINVGRGSAVDQETLMTALQEKHIGGAVLDVFDIEPLAPENPLWALPNVTITPHNAALSFPEQIAALFCANYLRFYQQKDLKHVVSFANGY